MRQYAGFGTAEESNRRYRYLLSQGTTGLSVAFDLPTQMGMDPDHPLAAGEVGRVGVSIASLADMERLFDGIPLDRCHHVDDDQFHRRDSAGALRSGRAGARARISRKLSGTVQNDILKEYIARGTYIYPPRPAMRIITDLFAWAGRRAARMEHDFDQRLSHSRSRLDRDSGSGVHAGQRHRLYRGRGRRRARRSMPSRRGSPSSSTRTTIFWRRSPSIARRAGSTRTSCTIASARRIRNR